MGLPAGLVTAPARPTREETIPGLWSGGRCRAASIWSDSIRLHGGPGVETFVEIGLR